jgi:hypothetical protein
MEPNQKSKTSAKDFFLNLGAIVALYTVVISVLNLLFTVINNAYPQITTYYYRSTQSISFPTATLIIVFPIFVVLMWLLQKSYVTEPEKKNLGVRKWLTYITLFIAGIVLAGDLVSVLYYFLDGQELTTGFLLKVFSVLVVTLGVFLYYISDIKGKFTAKSQKVWLAIACFVILASILWGFSVLGSPRTQQLLKYDEQKVTDLQNINSEVTSYWQVKGKLPNTLDDLSGAGRYFTVPVDMQSQKPYEYVLVNQNAKSYNLCAEFNITSPDAAKPDIYMRPIGYQSWKHPAGHWCFEQVIDQSQYPKPVPMMGTGM